MSGFLQSGVRVPRGCVHTSLHSRSHLGQALCTLTWKITQHYFHLILSVKAVTVHTWVWRSRETDQFLDTSEAEDTTTKHIRQCFSHLLTMWCLPTTQRHHSLICSPLYIFVLFWPVIRSFLWLCAQRSLLTGFGGPYGVPGIKSGLGKCLSGPPI